MEAQARRPIQSPYRRSTLTRFAVVASLLLGTALPSLAKDELPPPVPLGQLPNGPATLTNMSDRWDGMVVRTRVPLRVPKSSDKRGWSKGSWVTTEGDKTKMRVWVRERSALTEIIPRKEMLVGVTMVGTKWAAVNPKKGKGVFVEFDLVNYVGEVKLEFDKHVDELPQIEQYLRNYVLDVRGVQPSMKRSAKAAPSSSITRPAAPKVAKASNPRQPVAPSGPSAPDSAAPTMLEILNVECEPPSVAPGGSMQMVANYRVEGSGGDVTEKRRIIDSSGNELASFDESITRDTGTFKSSQPLSVPASTKPGRYMLEVTVRLGDKAFTKSANFEIQ